MVKRGKSEIYESIVDFLKKNGSSRVQTISEKTSTRWETVKSALETLEKSEFVQEKNNFYSLKQSLNFDKETILGIMIEPSEKEKISKIANRFRELWPKNKFLGKTFLQKMTVELIKKENLNLPYGWYLFGQCTALKMHDETLNKYGSEKKYDFKIKEIIEEYSQFNDTDELLEYHYKKEKKKLYLTRLSINNILKKNNLSRELILNVLDIQIQSLIWDFEKNSDNKDIFEILEGFHSIILKLSKLPVEKLNNLKFDIYTTFSLIWELIGSYNLYKSLNQDIKLFYDYNADILKDKIDNLLVNLKEYCPKIELSNKTKNLKSSLGL